MENIIIPDENRLEEIKKRISKEGRDKFHVLADFDQTLTKSFVKGKGTVSVISVLRNGNYLSPEYREKAHELANKYKPIEFDPKMSIEEKKPMMQEWWEKHFQLLIQSGLNLNDIKEVVKNRDFEFRDGAFKFLDMLKIKSIPLVIISSSGLGDAIFLYLEGNKKLYDNVSVITNRFNFNEKGYAISVKRPIITSMSKDEGSIKEHSIFNKIRNKKNVLLLGNSIADVKMIYGFEYDNLIKIGFLNENVEENLENFKNNFDVILLGDPGMDYINSLIKELFG